MTKLKYPSFVDRYFTKYYFRNKEAKDEDICILAHSNKICLLTLSPMHKALSEGPIKSVSYEFNGRNLVEDVKSVHGKKKLDSIKTHPYRIICHIVSGNNTTYKIRCGIQGKLLEVNENLLKNPTILNTKHGSEGYIGIVLHSNNKEVGSAKELLTQQQYDEINLKEDEDGHQNENENIKEKNLGIDQGSGVKESIDGSEGLDDSNEPELKRVKVEE